MSMNARCNHVSEKPASFTSAGLADLENRFNRTGQRRFNAMHLEHIYTQHAKNKAPFTKDGVFDESAFQQTRNLLGMVLLLTDKQNLSSHDEIYEDKRDTYSKSNLIWNEMLVGHLHDTYVPRLPPELRLRKIEPTVEGIFPPDNVEERQKAVYSAIKEIWGSI
jgi:Protein of unknown function (DUF1524)